ncbi:shikimate dehydrogenase [Propionispira arboris]|uniref:Shikimate dehydrogenase (NADP(+)) n=1 Tax=Propionispira arboris TaxID=84035 RepID=A0A1H6W3H7_9FIRM|nr:shikimate dehydrogenase [Propionispira arboris]
MLYTGKTKILGVIGCPVEHSLSPAMQNAALLKAGLDYAYIAMPVQPECLQNAVAGIVALGFRGFNVTIPHKVNIMSLLDTIDENSRMIGAVNTVVIEQGKLAGYNTDSIGFIVALKKQNFVIEHKKAALLGAGGAARAIIWGLISNKIQQIVIGVRNIEKVKPLVEEFKKFIDIELFHWEDPVFQKKLGSVDLLINTTPLGMHPKIDESPAVNWQYIKNDTFVYDIIYTPQETKFLAAAKKHGNPTLNGEQMLVEQGAAAFELWTKQRPDTQIMTEQLQKALG